MGISVAQTCEDRTKQKTQEYTRLGSGQWNGSSVKELEFGPCDPHCGRREKMPEFVSDLHLWPGLAYTNIRKRSRQRNQGDFWGVKTVPTNSWCSLNHFHYTKAIPAEQLASVAIRINSLWAGFWRWGKCAHKQEGPGDHRTGNISFSVFFNAHTVLRDLYS